MALLAGGILFGNGVWRVLAEMHRNRILAAACFDVGPAGSMTGFATVSFLGCSGMGHGLAHHRILEAALLVRVARNAGFAADVVSIPAARSLLRISSRAHAGGVRRRRGLVVRTRAGNRSSAQN